MLRAVGVAAALGAGWAVASACTSTSTRSSNGDCASGIPLNSDVYLQFSCGAPPTDAHVTGPCMLTTTSSTSYLVLGLGSGTCTFEATGPDGGLLAAPIAFESMVNGGVNDADCGLGYVPTTCTIAVSGIPSCRIEQGQEGLCACSDCTGGCSDIICADAGTMGD